MNTEVLQKLGLIDNEIKVYVELLKRGPSLASAISESTGLYRTHTYDVLRSLIEKEIVFFVIRENRKYFEAKKPDKLMSLLKRKEEELKQDETNMSTLILDMNKIIAPTKKKISAFVYQGKKGFKSLLTDILNIGEEYLVIGYNPRADEELKYFMPSFQKKRIKLGISRKIIMDNALRTKWASKQKLQEVKFIPKEYQIPMGIIIYDKRVVIVTIEEEEFTALCIESEKINDNFRKFFDMLWRIAKI